ncbi:S8 family serine peptidase [Streptomyces sp. NPDC048518]|uniref:S8 family serine peptidase n=1 Tax=Streptomyces sp. NPDC048518 TaxID=3155029 RepID=UPI003401BA11
MSSAIVVLAVASGALAPGAVAEDVRPKQWYLDAMSAQQLWKESTGRGIKVAVVDTGVRETPGLKGRLRPGRDVTGMHGDARNDYDGHGTTMAELIAGSGQAGGLRGLAPEAELIPIRTGLGKQSESKTSDSAAAIRAAADSDARIISMSFGGPYPYPDTKAAVKYAQSRGKLLFASVGNEAKKEGSVSYPAAYPGVIGVAAADKTGKVAKTSEFGPHVDLAAPGLNIPRWCDASFRSYCENGSGTSFGTAIASASAALVWSKHPDWTANQVLRVLIDTAGRDWPKDEPSDYLGYGLIRPARNVVKGEGKPGPADVDPITNKKTTGPGTEDGGSSPTASASPQPAKGAATDGKEPVSAERASDDGGSNTLWPVLGGLAAVLAIGGGAFAALRARRRA